MSEALDEGALLLRAQGLAGRSLAELARGLRLPVPPDLRGNKGWIGQVVELAMGVAPNSFHGPDFPEAGVELKTIPVTEGGLPTASTWVAVAPLDGSLSRPWEGSLVQQKLASVLWVPVRGRGEPGSRVVGCPLLWHPSAAEEALLRADWATLTEQVAEGAFARISAREGVALQLRPKAARSGEWVWALDEEGEWVRTTPLGFYLRQRFTRQIFLSRRASEGCRPASVP